MQGYKRPVEWMNHTSIYEVNVRQYTPEGTFSAFMASLPRLKKMGVQTLWLMPVTPIAKEKMKGTLGSYYACADYTSINPEFGTLDDFKLLVKGAQAMGFKIIIDWVANHTGWGHTWAATHPDFYKKNEDGSFKIASGMDDIIELDYANPAMRLAMIDAMNFWVTGCGIDGFRCDLASWVPVDFWQQARPALGAVKPLFWLGEFDELENPEYGTVFDASYSWKWMHLTEDFYKQQLPVRRLVDLLKQYSTLEDTTMRAWFTSNHDENSWNGTEYEKYGPCAAPLAVFSCTWNGVPLLYSGQELPLKDKRLKFFDKDLIPWTGHYQLADFYQKLLQLKSNNPALRGGDSNVSTIILSEENEGEKIVAFARVNNRSQVLVFLNFSDEAVTFSSVSNIIHGNYADIFNRQNTHSFSGEIKVQLAPYGYAVYEKLL